LYRKIDHIGIAVRDLAAAIAQYSKIGLDSREIEEVQSQKARVAMIPIGESRLELVEATENDSPISKFIAKRGEGVHHICFQVEDIAAELKILKTAGLRLVDESPRPGAGGCLVAFIHPSATGGVLIELSQPHSLPHN
jgi:methylmalonyl-CoA/ethylmalonyl-CoA epimerase